MLARASRIATVASMFPALRLLLSVLLLSASFTAFAPLPATAQQDPPALPPPAAAQECNRESVLKIRDSIQAQDDLDYTAVRNIASYRNCDWFSEIVCPRMEGSVNLQAQAAAERAGRTTVVSQLYQNCSWFTTEAPAADADHYSDFLPIYRWGDVSSIRTFGPSSNAITEAIEFVITALASFAFWIASLAWSLVRGLMALSSAMSNGIFEVFAPTVNQVFSDIGGTIQGFLAVALLVVGFSLVRAFISGRRKAEAVRNVAILILFSAIFFSIALGSKAAVDNGRPDLSVGTAAWVGSTAVNVGSLVTDPLTQRLQGGANLQISGVEEAFGTGEVSNSSCDAYSSLLYGEAARTGASGPMRMLSTMWEASYLKSFQRSQFGESGANDLPGHVICHFADDQAGVDRNERFRFVSQLAPNSYSQSSPFFADHDRYDQLGEAVTAAAACRIVDGEWRVAPDYVGLLTDGNCHHVFTASDTTIDGASNRDDGMVGGSKTFQLYGLPDTLFTVRSERGIPEGLGDEGTSLAEAISSSAARGFVPLTGGVASVVGAFSVVMAFGIMALALAFSAFFALFAIGFLLPLLLVLLAAQSKKSKTIGRLTASLLAVNIFMQLLMFSIMAITILIQSVVTGMIGSVPLISDFLLGIAPFLAMALTKNLLRRFNFGGKDGMRKSDWLTLPGMMAMRMSGIKSLQELSKVDGQNRNAFHRLADRTKKGSRLRKMAEKDRDETLGGRFFRATEGRNDGIRGRLNRLASGTESHRRWKAERENRAKFAEASRIAREIGEPPPRTLAEAEQMRRLRERKKTEGMSDNLYDEAARLMANGELQRWETSGTVEEKEKAKALRRAYDMGKGYIPSSEEQSRIRAAHALVFGGGSSASERANAIVENFGPQKVDDLGAPHAETDPKSYDTMDPEALEDVNLSEEWLAARGSTSRHPSELLASNDSLAEQEVRVSRQRLLEEEGEGYSSMAEVQDPKVRTRIASESRKAGLESMVAVASLEATGEREGRNGNWRRSVSHKVAAELGTSVDKVQTDRYGQIYLAGDDRFSEPLGNDDVPELSFAEGATAAVLRDRLMEMSPKDRELAFGSLENWVLTTKERKLPQAQKLMLLKAKSIAYGFEDSSSGETVNMEQAFEVDLENPQSVLKGILQVRQYTRSVESGAVSREKVIFEALERMDARDGYSEPSQNSITLEQVDYYKTALSRAEQAGVVVRVEGTSDFRTDDENVRGSLHALSERIKGIEEATKVAGTRAGARNAVSGQNAQEQGEKLLREVEQALQILAATEGLATAAGTISVDGFAGGAEKLREEAISRIGETEKALDQLREIVESEVLRPSINKSDQDRAQAAAQKIKIEVKNILSQADAKDWETVGEAAKGVCERAESKGGRPAGWMLSGRRRMPAVKPAEVDPFS